MIWYEGAGWVKGWRGESGGGLLQHSNASRYKRETSWTAERLLVYQEGLCYLEIVELLNGNSLLAIAYIRGSQTFIACAPL
jgi:hypothetical protein